MEERGEIPALPDNPAPHLTEWFFELGPTVAVGMGEGPIGWQDMFAWSGLTGIELDPWEAQTLRRMSQGYLSQRLEAKRPDCPAPYSLDREQVRDRVANQFKAMVGAFRKG